jgi:hypothetical protein
MKQTSICGIDHNQDLRLAPNASLERLLAQLGRNGPIESDGSLAAREAEIQSILDSRRATGVIIYDDGIAHHVV